MIQVELFQALLFLLRTPMVDLFGNREGQEQGQREGDTVLRGDLFGEQVGDRDGTQDAGGDDQADGDLPSRHAQVEGRLVLLVVPLEAQRRHAQGLEEEAPHHAERVRFRQDRHVAAAVEDGGELQNRDHVDDAVGGAVLALRVAEPGHQHAVLGHAIQHAVGADDRRVDRARKNQPAHDHHEDVERQPQGIGPAQIHRQAADQVGEVLGPFRHRE